jgi:hypothetical protein
MTAAVTRPGYFLSILTGKCPRCREGHIYCEKSPYKLKSVVKMNEKCSVCGQPTEIEVGFYYGTGYVSYLIALLLTAASFLVWLLTIGFSFHDRRFLFWIIANSIFLVLLQAWLMRFSRVLWLSWFVPYDPDWKDHEPEDLGRTIEGEMNNW